MLTFLNIVVGKFWADKKYSTFLGKSQENAKKIKL